MRVLIDRMAQARDQLMSPYPDLTPSEPEAPKGKSKKF